MAIVSCRECNREVSTSAATCPHCGVGKPASKSGGNTANRLLIGAGVVAVVVFLFSKNDTTSGGSSSGTDAIVTAEQAAKDAECRKNLQCWGDKGTISAGIYCKREIEKLAKFSMKWTDAWYEPKFSRFRWARGSNDTPGLVTFVGDRAEFQNGYGAYQNVIYTCDMVPDDKSNRVYDVTATPGRLN